MPTWFCPIRPNHRFTGDHSAWLRYIEHFEVPTVDDTGVAVGPHTSVVKSKTFNTPPVTAYEVLLTDIFLSIVPIHVAEINGLFRWKSSVGVGAFLMLVRGANADMQIDPLNWFVYDGYDGFSGESPLAAFDPPQPPNRPARLKQSIPINWTVPSIRLQVNEYKKATDSLNFWTINVRGYV